MIDFFDKSFWQLIVSGLLVLLIGSLFVGKKEASAAGTGKGGKIIVVIGWLIFWGGIVTFLSNYPKGMNDASANIGISLIFFGSIINLIGKFIIWWQR